MESALKNLNAFVLLQALFGMVLLSFVCFALLFSRHTLAQQSLHTHATTQLALYANSALRLVEAAIARQSLVLPQTPQTLDHTHPVLLGTITEPYSLALNLVALTDELGCVELVVKAHLPDNLTLHYYDSALLRGGKILRPKMPCAVSRMF